MNAIKGDEILTAPQEFTRSRTDRLSSTPRVAKHYNLQGFYSAHAERIALRRDMAAAIKIHTQSDYKKIEERAVAISFSFC